MHYDVPQQQRKSNHLTLAVYTQVTQLLTHHRQAEQWSSHHTIWFQFWLYHTQLQPNWKIWNRNIAIIITINIMMITDLHAMHQKTNESTRHKICHCHCRSLASANKT